MVTKEDKDGQIKILKNALIKIYNATKQFDYDTEEYELNQIADNALRDCTF